MRILKLTIAYDGTAYVGWQRQAGGTSIQGLLEAALGRLEGADVAVVGAGRTDAGVHAQGQVASVRMACPLEATELWRAVNAQLPLDVRVVALEEAPHDFHARYGARAKRYAYRLVNGPLISPFDLRYAWHVTHPLDLVSMASALDVLKGRHDFAAFQAAGSRVRDTTRTIAHASIERLPAFGLRASPAEADRTLVIWLGGDGFLRHMVRNIVGTLVEVGRGRWPAGFMADLLASRDRGRAGPTAPAQGLFLVDVQY